MGWIDTHSHLQADSLRPKLPELLSAARRAGVESILICAGNRADWDAVRETAHAWGLPYMLGIHPMSVPETSDEDLRALRPAVEEALTDPFFVGIGEVGLDGIVPGAADARAEAVLLEQLRTARDFRLPLSLHVRKSASRLLMCLRRIPPVGGVVHAFNGSDVEREAFLKLGLKLGFGGALTYAGSLRIRRHAAEIPVESFVLETDAPDMPGSARRDRAAEVGMPPLTEPADIVETARAAASLRGVTLEGLSRTTRAAALAAFPRLASALSHPQAFARRG